MEPKALAKGTSEAAVALVGLLDELEKSRPTQGKPIVTGFSQGGMMSFTLATLYPDRIGEALPIAGTLAPPLYPSPMPMGKRTPPIHAFHGDADGIVPLESDRNAVQALTTAGFSVELSVYPGVRHTVSPDMRRDVHKALAEALSRSSAF